LSLYVAPHKYNWKRSHEQIGRRRTSHQTAQRTASAAHLSVADPDLIVAAPEASESTPRRQQAATYMTRW
jgi:hypothetical protein